MSVETEYSLLKDLQIDNDQVKEVHMRLVDIENF